ncbi:MAG: Cation efflux system protein [Candidatus Magasanikbacteria bacterium GW2011_GWC2_40_17]|uniref:Cation efflux system protein n=1 Tax=Candidatus Magasanikbacteria bacterium GW2011_GWA2_42_32 TaxID=1619039 RepID=A0A0G1CE86_9BACT|nr:MAG: Cation efflux system protein [Candidatus Magasanikbacteria bacterium GW2011_GWC2_40_17]KKS57001.1 MAG: Cation efflux system protein [Candidatus Magasanikbacteria bacterium GW2011_GWA2_42_32]OGH85728.1 MAG: cobalt transporter [Candidatus Magasanikbacteria bacterium RIFOXYB2_FULL_38_10]
MHDHAHTREKNIIIAAFLNIGFTVIEVIGGLWTNSLAILSDAIHDLGDSIVLIFSLILEKKSNAPADKKRTFGYRRLSLISALLAGVILVAGSLFILARTVPRILNPEHVNATGMIGLAVVGLIFNSIGFLRLKKGMSMNEKVLSWHLLEDVLGWGVILIGAVIIKFWDNHIIDPLMTIGFTVFTLWGVSKNIKETFNIFLQGVPAHIDLEKIKQDILSLNGIRGVHDIHVWSMEGETNIFTGHIIATNNLLKLPEQTKKQIRNILILNHIEHATIELEDEQKCSDVECKI